MMRFVSYFCTFFFAFSGIALADIYNPNSINRKQSFEESVTSASPIEIELTHEIFADFVTPEQNSPESISTRRFYTIFRPNFKFNFSDNVSLDTTWSFEDVGQNSRNPYATDELMSRNIQSSTFDNHGLIVEQLMFKFTPLKSIEFSVGKINPVFGAGYNRYSRDIFDNNWYGISGTFLNTGYELREKLGFQLNVKFVDTETVEQRFTLSAFRDDDSDLFDAIGTNKGNGSPTAIRSSRYDYYPNNAASDDSFRSYSISNSGKIKFGDEKSIFAYNLSHRYQLSDNQVSEDGYAASANYRYFLSYYTKLGAFLEHVRINNSNGIKNNDQNYFTSSVYMNYSGFNFALLYSNFSNSLQDYKVGIRTTEISLGYDFESGIGAYIARRNIDSKNSQNGVDVNMVNIRYRVKFH